MGDGPYAGSRSWEAGLSLRILVHDEVEVLERALGETLASTPPGPYRSEAIVVSNPALAQWLTLALARRFGVWASGAPVFPRRLCDALLASRPLRSPVPGAHEWTVAAMVPALFDIVRDLLAGPEVEGEALAPVRAYLGRAAEIRGPRRIPGRVGIADRDADEGVLLGLVEALAGVFDGYHAEAPELVRRWYTGGWAANDGSLESEERWQRVFWRALAERFETPPAAVLASDDGWLDRLDAVGIGPRISVFGDAALSPLHVEILTRAARRLDVTVYAVASDLCSSDDGACAALAPFVEQDTRRDRSAIALWRRATAELGVPLHGPRRVGGGDSVEATSDVRSPLHVPSVVEPSPVVPSRGLPAPASLLLGGLRQVLRGRAPDLPVAVPPAPDALGTPGASVRVHACHGPLREVEVLRNELLAAFDPESPAHLPGLRADEVVVAVSDIERYGPLIEAVFGSSSPTSAGRIPFVVGGRAVRGADSVVETVFELLAAARERLTVSVLFSLLQRPRIRKRFGLGRDAVGAAREAIVGAGFRWGYDTAERRLERGLEDELHTARHAIDRVLSAAMLDAGATSDGTVDGFSEGARAPWHGLVPPPHTDLGTIDAVARVSAFVERFDRLRGAMRQRRGTAAWCDAIRAMVEELVVEAAESRSACAALFGALADIEAAAHASAAADAPIPLDAVARRLDEALRARFVPVHRVPGVVVFGELRAVADIPARVVGLLGFDDQQIPRHSLSPGFDRIAEERRSMGRDAAGADRAGLLHAVFAARERLIVTYVGSDPRSDEERPASVLVEELVEACDELLGLLPRRGCSDDDRRHLDAERKARGVVVRHPLQPWSERYGDGERRDARLVAYAARRAPRASEPDRERDALPFEFAPPGLLFEPRGADEWSVGDLARALSDAPAHWLKRALGVKFDATRGEAGDALPSKLDHLQRWQIGDCIVRALLAGREPDSDEVFERSGMLPTGLAGEAEIAGIRAGAEAIAARVRDERRCPVRREHIRVEVDVGGRRVTVSGTIDVDETESGVWVCYSKLSTKREFELRLRSLLLAAHSGTGRFALFTRVDGGDPKRTDCSIDGADDARAALAEVVELVEALERSPRPLGEKLFKEVLNALDRARKAGLEVPTQASLAKAVSIAIQPGWRSDGQADVFQTRGDETKDRSLIRAFGEYDVTERLIEHGVLDWTLRVLRALRWDGWAVDTREVTR